MPAFHVPTDRLTRMANDLGSGLEDHPLYREGDKVIVLVDDNVMGGIGVMGYEDPREALIDMFVHTRKMAEAFDINLDIMFPDHN